MVFPECCDEPPSDNPKFRLIVADDIQRAIWNILLPTDAFSPNKDELKAEIRKGNSKRWLSYGPGTHDQDDETALETYRSMRASGYIAGSDAPEYDAHCKQAVAKKKQKKGPCASSD